MAKQGRFKIQGCSHQGALLCRVNNFTQHNLVLIISVEVGRIRKGMIRCSSCREINISYVLRDCKFKALKKKKKRLICEKISSHPSAERFNKTLLWFIQSLSQSENVELIFFFQSIKACQHKKISLDLCFLRPAYSTDRYVCVSVH